MTQRAELRRQWQQHCKDHEYIPWAEWKPEVETVPEESVDES